VPKHDHFYATNNVQDEVIERASLHKPKGYLICSLRLMSQYETTEKKVTKEGASELEINIHISFSAVTITTIIP
jgi:hypothetical protein